MALLCKTKVRPCLLVRSEPDFSFCDAFVDQGGRDSRICQVRNARAPARAYAEEVCTAIDPGEVFSSAEGSFCRVTRVVVSSPPTQPLRSGLH
jgi:hypothetical protein